MKITIKRHEKTLQECFRKCWNNYNNILYHKNIKRRREYANKWRKDHSEEIKEYHREYYKTHKSNWDLYNKKKNGK